MGPLSRMKLGAISIIEEHFFNKMNNSFNARKTENLDPDEKLNRDDDSI